MRCVKNRRPGGGGDQQAISVKWQSKKLGFARTCSTGSRCWRSSCPPWPNAKKICRCCKKFFLDQFALQLGRSFKGLTRRAQSVLSRYFWPGNIRELQNVIGHGCMMATGDLIDLPDLPEYLHSRESAREGQGLLTLEEVEKRHVHSVLTQVGGNKQEAAEILGISRATIYRILSQKEHPMIRVSAHSCRAPRRIPAPENGQVRMILNASRGDRWAQWRPKEGATTDRTALLRSAQANPHSKTGVNRPKQPGRSF